MVWGGGGSEIFQGTFLPKGLDLFFSIWVIFSGKCFKYYGQISQKCLCISGVRGSNSVSPKSYFSEEVFGQKLSIVQRIL